MPSQSSGSLYIGLEHVESGTTRILGNSTAIQMRSSAAKFEQGDVLYGRLRPYLNKVIRAPFSGLCSTEFIVFPRQPHLLSTFLLYRLNSSEFVSFASHLNGGDRPRVDFAEIGRFRICLPPLAEQRRIVAKIEELFSDLDAGVAALERVKANLKRYRAAVLKAAVEGKLTAEWRKKNPPTETGQQLLKRILAERQRKWEEEQLRKFAEKGKTPPKDWKEKYQSPIHIECNNLPTIPTQWTWCTLDCLCEVVGGITKGQRHAAGARLCEVPYLRVANVQRGFIDLNEVKTIAVTDEDAATLRLRAGDILFNEGGDRDKLGRGWVWQGEIANCIHQNHVFRARAFAASLQPKFISFHGNSFGKEWFMRAGKQSVNLASINLGVLRRFPVPLPPSKEQTQIVAEVERRLSVADAVAAEVERSLQRAASLRQAILKRAFEGKLVPQNPADEPAAVLLERIKAQRSTASAKPKPAKPARNARPKLSQKVWLARATIAAYAINALTDQPTFGRVQLQKFLYLAQEHIGVDLQFEFEKQAAGPFDKDIYKIESNAKQQKWFYATGNSGDAARYVIGPKIQDRLTWADRMFKKQLPDIDKLIEHLRGMNTEQAELFATIYAVWRELLSSGTPSTAENTSRGLYAWHESKKRFTRQRIERCIKWMRERGYAPAAQKIG